MTAPKRHDSGELPTIYAPRPPESLEGALAEYLARLGAQDRDADTKVSCPRCSKCHVCRDFGIVTVEERAKWLASAEALHQHDAEANPSGAKDVDP